MSEIFYNNSDFIALVDEEHERLLKKSKNEKVDFLTIINDELDEELGDIEDWINEGIAHNKKIEWLEKFPFLSASDDDFEEAFSVADELGRHLDELDFAA